MYREALKRRRNWPEISKVALIILLVQADPDELPNDVVDDEDLFQMDDGEIVDH